MYKIQPSLFKKFLSDIIAQNISYYGNKRDADNLLLNTTEDNESILARIEEYTNNIEKLKNFENKLQLLYSEAIQGEYTSAYFIREVLTKCADEYSDENININTFYADLVFLAIDEYIQFRAKENSSIRPSVKLVNVLVSKKTKFSFNGTEARSAYTVISQNSDILEIKEDPENPWSIIVKGVKQGAGNIIIEDAVNQVSTQVPVIVLPSTLMCPVEVQVIETQDVSFEISSNLETDVSGLYLDNGEYKDSEREFCSLTRSGNIVTVHGIKPGVETINISNYDKSRECRLVVKPGTLETQVQEADLYVGKHVIVPMKCNIPFEYSIENVLNSDVIKVQFSKSADDNYNILIRAINTGKAILHLKAGTRTKDIMVNVKVKL